MASPTDRVQRQTQEDIRRRRAEEERERRSTIAGLRTQARTLIAETRYQEALGVVDQILVLDANDEYATGVRPLVEDRALLQQQRRFREDFDRQFTKQLNAPGSAAASPAAHPPAPRGRLRATPARPRCS